jgi:hypothetical protein
VVASSSTVELRTAVRVFVVSLLKGIIAYFVLACALLGLHFVLTRYFNVQMPRLIYGMAYAAIFAVSVGVWLKSYQSDVRKLGGK